MDSSCSSVMLTRIRRISEDSARGDERMFVREQNAAGCAIAAILASISGGICAAWVAFVFVNVVTLLVPWCVGASCRVRPDCPVGEETDAARSRGVHKTKLRERSRSFVGDCS